jgi:hypothetical protein
LPLQVTLVARGEHLKAMTQNGLTLLVDGKELVARENGTSLR